MDMKHTDREDRGCMFRNSRVALLITAPRTICCLRHFLERIVAPSEGAPACIAKTVGHRCGPGNESHARSATTSIKHCNATGSHVDAAVTDLEIFVEQKLQMSFVSGSPISYWRY